MAGALCRKLERLGWFNSLAPLKLFNARVAGIMVMKGQF